MGVRFILNAFPAQAVVDCRNHPRRDEDREKFDIPYQLSALWDVLLRDASHLSIYDSRVGLASLGLPCGSMRRFGFKGGWVGSVVGSLTGDSTSLLITRSPGTNKPSNLVYFSTSVFFASTTLLQFTVQTVLVVHWLIWNRFFTSFFFPSCASVALARSSHTVVLMNELPRCIFCIPLWGVESGVRTITQSEVLSGQKEMNRQTTKQNHNNNRFFTSFDDKLSLDIWMSSTWIKSSDYKLPDWNLHDSCC